ncbi:MAG TPA: hypothetical protein VF177_12565 [Anaerolineae bacterium]
MFRRRLEICTGRRSTVAGRRSSIGLLMSKTRHYRLALAGLLLIVAWIYAPALNFGFIWDDPLWYGHVVGKSWLETVKPNPDFQFYRPGTMLYMRLFLQGDSAFAAPLLHWTQIGWHLVNVALVYALSRRLGLGRGTTFAVATLVALYPFSHQAVAWAAPQQPWVAALQNGAWLTYLLAQRMEIRKWRPVLSGGPESTLGPRREEGLEICPERSRRIRDWRRSSVVGRRSFYLSLLLFVLALAVQESTVALAFIPLLLGVMMRLNTANLQSLISNLQSPISNLQPLAYPLLAVVFGVVWFLVPRKADITGLVLDERVTLYLLQGFIYPLLGRPLGYAPGYTLSPLALVLLFVLTITLLLALATWQGRGHFALFGLLWALLVIAPATVGLRYSYVSLAPRLLYGAAPGVALLWVSALWPQRPYKPLFWRLAGALLLALAIVQSGWLLSNFQQLYQTGVDHMTDMLAAMSEDGQYLFVNFPDRYAPERPPYPVGYWGVTLAPIVVELGDFAALLFGSTPQTLSHSLPSIDAQARAEGPYQIDMRGVILQPHELYTLATGWDAIYLSRYLPDGRFDLERAGSLTPQAGSACRLALFAELVCLQSVQVENAGDALQVRLSWLTRTPLPPHLTIFAHLGQPDQPPLAQADGDTWRGMLPLSVWQPGDLIHEWRTLNRPPLAEEIYLLIGVYDRTTGERLRATTTGGQPLHNNAYVQPLSE